MQPALLIRLRPLGPWRFGPADGARDRVDTLYRSDRLFSAVTLAMQQLGLLNAWLQSTARSPEPEIVFSSVFPFQTDTLFAAPPVTLWPPPAAQVVAPNPVFLAKIRWNSVRFVPLAVIDALLTGGRILAEQWLPDSDSGCLLRRDRPSSSPFRTALRHSAAVDRLTRMSGSTGSAACVEFEPGAGLWAIVRYRDTTVEAAWHESVEAAFRLLSDSGFGGRRTSGWGQAAAPEFERGVWPALILPRVARLNRDRTAADSDEDRRYWMLSLYSPAASDQIDWTTGDYRITVRAGRVDSNGASGTMKKSARLVEEGSVLTASLEPLGAAVDVAPDGWTHPVYRSGLALALELPRVQPQPEAAEESAGVEMPATEDAIVDRVCEPVPDLDKEPTMPTPSEKIETTAPPDEPLPPAQSAPEPPPNNEPAPIPEITPEPPPTVEEIEPPSEVQPSPETESEPPVPSDEGVASHRDEQPSANRPDHPAGEHSDDAL